MRITPETKVGELLEAHPELEALLIQQAPAFERLKNPVLRKTVAKVATLRQAAKIASIDVGELVLALRRAVGQSDDAVDPTHLSPLADDAQPPAWTGSITIRETIDVDRLLAGGEHPLGRVRALLADLPETEAIRLLSGFRPEPLIETLTAEGYRIHCSRLSEDRWETVVAGTPGRSDRSSVSM